MLPQQERKERKFDAWVEEREPFREPSGCCYILKKRLLYFLYGGGWLCVVVVGGVVVVVVGGGGGLVVGLVGWGAAYILKKRLLYFLYVHAPRVPHTRSHTRCVCVSLTTPPLVTPRQLGHAYS